MLFIFQCHVNFHFQEKLYHEKHWDLRLKKYSWGNIYIFFIILAFFWLWLIFRDQFWWISFGKPRRPRWPIREVGCWKWWLNFHVISHHQFMMRTAKKTSLEVLYHSQVIVVKPWIFLKIQRDGKETWLTRWVPSWKNDRPIQKNVKELPFPFHVANWWYLLLQSPMLVSLSGRLYLFVAYLETLFKVDEFLCQSINQSINPSSINQSINQSPVCSPVVSVENGHA